MARIVQCRVQEETESTNSDPPPQEGLESKQRGGPVALLLRKETDKLD